MPSLGPAEILVILVIALLVFGPDKMPDIARQVGRGFREFRRVQDHLKAELRDVVSEFDSEDLSKETGTPVPAATGDPVPSLSPFASPETTPGAGVGPPARRGRAAARRSGPAARRGRAAARRGRPPAGRAAGRALLIRLW